MGVALTLAVGCGGATGNDDLEVNDVGSSNAALQGPSDSTDTTGNEGSEVGDKDCKDGDHDGHGHHHRHKFKVLDALDGVVDHQITIANLPADLPQHLIDKLHKIDANGDGIVTKDEVKAFRKAHKHGDRDRDRDHEGDRDGDRDEQH